MGANPKREGCFVGKFGNPLMTKSLDSQVQILSKQFCSGGVTGLTLRILSAADAGSSPVQNI